MRDLFNPKWEQEEIVDGLDISPQVKKVRKTTELERDAMQFILDVDYAIELNSPEFPVKTVFVGFNGSCHELGDGKVFVDMRTTSEVVKHEMIHSWYGDLDANQIEDLLDTYMRHEPDFLGGRGRVHSNPLISYRDISSQVSGIGTPQLMEKISTLEEAVTMKEGDFVDYRYEEEHGKSKLQRYVKTGDSYRSGETLNHDDLNFEPWLIGEREEFLRIYDTLNEYLAYGAMHSKPTMPEPIYNAMVRNGFNNVLFEERANQVMSVINQLRAHNQKYKEKMTKENDSHSQ